MVGPVQVGALPLTGGTLTGPLIAPAGTAALPGVGVGGTNIGLYSTGSDATGVLGISVNGASVATVSNIGRVNSNSGYATDTTSNQAFYGSGTTSGVQIGSAGYDVHTAGLCYVGKTTATGVQIGKSGGTVGLYATAAVAQAATIANADGTLADITTKFNTLLTAVKGIGVIAAA